MRTLIVLLIAFCIFSNALALPNVARCVRPEKLLYRTYDGECNNVLFPDWGRALEYYSNGPEGREAYPWATVPQVRPLPTYADVDTLPSSGPRGNARDISNALCTREDDEEIDPINHSMFSVMFAQFINHDMENNQMVNASSREFFPLVTYLIDREESQCQPATAPPQAFSHGPRCEDEHTILTSEARNTGGTRLPDGTFRARNNASAYLDLDLVYGRNSQLADIIRSHTGGKLRLSPNSMVMNIPGVGPTNFTFEDMLPSYPETGLPVNPSFPEGIAPEKHNTIFTAGDERVNENVALTFFHTLFVREHNKVCDELMNRNPLWKLLPNVFDEVIYQKARAIVIAKYQKVVYEEYFPNAFGSHFTNLLGNYQGYNPLIDTSTNLAFSGAAFRYGHFTIRNYHSLDECGNAISFGGVSPDPTVKINFLGMAAQNPDFLTPLGVVATVGGFENIVRGLINERAAPNDLSVLWHIRDLALPTGVLDLITLDIARQRFNTLPNYQRIRKHYRNVDPVTDNIYGAPGCPSYLEHSNDDDPIECFNYITSDSTVAQKLKNVYRKVNLIDAVIGVTAEDKVAGTSFGHTQGNIIVEQFKKFRDGDRFFYKALLNSGFFTQEERNDILGTTMTDILRRNTNVGDEIPSNPFQSPDNYRQSLIDSCQS